MSWAVCQSSSGNHSQAGLCLDSCFIRLHSKLGKTLAELLRENNRKRKGAVWRQRKWEERWGGHGRKQQGNCEVGNSDVKHRQERVRKYWVSCMEWNSILSKSVKLHQWGNSPDLFMASQHCSSCFWKLKPIRSVTERLFGLRYIWCNIQGTDPSDRRAAALGTSETGENVFSVLG